MLIYKECWLTSKLFIMLQIWYISPKIIAMIAWNKGVVSQLVPVIIIYFRLFDHIYTSILLPKEYIRHSMLSDYLKWKQLRNYPSYDSFIDNKYLSIYFIFHRVSITLFYQTNICIYWIISNEVVIPRVVSKNILHKNVTNFPPTQKTGQVIST